MTSAVIEDVLFTHRSVSKIPIRVVVFPHDLGAVIPHDGFLVGGGKATPYTGPCYAHGPGGARRPAVIVSGGKEADHLRPGVTVRFNADGTPAT